MPDCLYILLIFLILFLAGVNVHILYEQGNANEANNPTLDIQTPPEKVFGPPKHV